MKSLYEKQYKEYEKKLKDKEFNISVEKLSIEGQLGNFKSRFWITNETYHIGLISATFVLFLEQLIEDEYPVSIIISILKFIYGKSKGIIEINSKIVDFFRNLPQLPLKIAEILFVVYIIYIVANRLVIDKINEQHFILKIKLQVIEDIQKDNEIKKINIKNSIDLIEKSITDADITLKKCYESLNKTDLFLSNLDNKNKAYNAVSSLKSINDKKK